MKNYNAAIVGVGAIGTYIAAKLQESGMGLLLLGRQDGNDRSTRLYNRSGGETLLTSSRGIGPGDCSIAIFALKAYDLEGALRQYRDILTPCTHWLVLSNGYVEPVLRGFLDIQTHIRLYQGVATVGVRQVAPRAYEQTSRFSRIEWGPFMGRCSCGIAPEMQRILSTDPFKYCEEIEGSVQKKWLINMVLNTICAALMLKKNGDILSHQELLGQVFAESFTLGQRLWPRFPFNEEKLFKELREIIVHVRDNQNSMVVDLNSNRKTEIDFLSALASQYDDFPTLNRLTEKIRARQKNGSMAVTS